MLLEAHRALPAIFALSAGYGDMAIGVTAALVAWQLVERRQCSAFIAWPLLGITDLVVAVSLETTAGPLQPHGASMVAMTVLPLSLVATFLVLLFFIFHVICIVQAKSWKSVVENRQQAAGPVQCPAH